MKYSDSFGKKSSKILLGTAYFGDTISESEAFDIMDTFGEYGGNHIDTARLYANGEAEKVVGKWLESRKPKDIIVSTKGGYPNDKTPDIMRISEEEIRFDLENSLRALNLDCVDFYWLHRDDEKRSVEEIIDYLNDFVKEGKIKRFGASNWTTERIIKANEYAKKSGKKGFSASQIRFSPAHLVDGGDARSLVTMDFKSFEIYKTLGIPVAAYASQAKGFFSKMADKGVDSLTPKSRDRYYSEENLRRLDLIEALSGKYNISVASTVCALLTSITSPDVFPIIGGSRKEQIADSLRGADAVIENKEIKDILEFNI
ncbi:MAG: aldo/keto reductase [Clostridia bacterium]|nr:aldo/keto reductase [Clostridia bacterium]